MNVRVHLSGFVLLWITLLLLPPSTLAASPVRFLGRIVEASETRPKSDIPSIATDAFGNTRAVWAGEETSAGDPPGIYLRSFSNRGGRPIGASKDHPVRIDSDREGVFVSEPVIAMNSTGRFIVVWEAGGGGQTNIVARRFSAFGEPLDPAEFVLNKQQTEDRRNPDVAVFESVITAVWIGNSVEEPVSLNIFAKTFTFDTPIQTVTGNTELVVASLQEFDAGEPAVAANVDGAVVVWEDGAADIRGRTIHSVSPELRDEFSIPSDPTGSQVGPAIAMNANGRYVVSWLDAPDPLGPSRAQGRVFRFPAEPQGGQFPLLGNNRGRVSMDQRGRFAYVAARFDGMSSLVGQLFRPDGRTLGREFPAGFDPEPGRFQNGPTLALDADGDFSVAFFGDNRDGDPAIQVRRFRGPEPIDLQAKLKARPRNDRSGTPRALTASVTNLHPVETITGFPAIDAAIGAALDPLLRLTLPSSGVQLPPFFDFAPKRDGRCQQQTVPFLDCFEKGSLPAGDRARVVFELIPQRVGSFETRLKVETDSFDPDEEDPDSSNNRAVETFTAS